jgi:alpha-1,6-mannosyltransferase
MIVTPLRFLWLILSAASYVILAYFVPRQQFGWLISLLTVLFLGYAWAIRRIDKQREGSIDRVLFASAIGFRLLLLFAVPCLSDDVYRFVWDGHLLAHGFNPYLYLPSRLVETDFAVRAGLERVLFQQLNSPDYFTVYPPLNQAIFGLAAWLSPYSLLGNIVWLRLPILLSEIGSLWLMTRLLRRLTRNPNLALLYGLNPLVILELTGNLHFEAVMIFFTLLAGWWLLTERWIRSAGALALAIGTKLLPLLLLPLIVRWLGWRKGMVYALLAGVFTILQFLPFASLELVQNVVSSVNLYFQKFEFNASVYYVLRSIGYWIKGYNAIETIGFWLSITTTLSILWISFRWRNVSVPAQILAVLTLYFGFATTVHPWYITTIVAASVFTRFRYPLVWAALIPVSYFTYQTIPYHENLWLTLVEYGIVAVVLLLDVIKSRQKMPVY